MNQLFSNNAAATLASDVSSTDTTITLATGTGALFTSPASGQKELATLLKPTDTTVPVEIIKIISRSGDILTVERGQEGTASAAWPASSTSIQGRITAATLSSFPQGVTTHINETFMNSFFAMAKMDEGNDGNECLTNTAQSVLFSPYIDIGVPPNWTASTAYHHGDIVIPSTPNGTQYRWNAENSTSIPNTKQTLVTSSTEPTWPTGSGNSVADAGTGAGMWVSMNIPGTYSMQTPPAGSIFVPLQFGFVAHGAFSALTGTPMVSIGSDNTNSTSFVSWANLTVSAPYGFQLFTPASNLAIQSGDNILFDINSPATTGRCVGRFFVQGFFVELPVHS